jgi:class 3 adenylate cyclase
VGIEDLHPDLQEWVARVEELDWAGMVVDADWRMQWASRPMMEFVGATPETAGLGLHALEVFSQEVWLSTVHPDSQPEMFLQLAPPALRDLAQKGRDPKEVLPEQFVPLFEQIDLSGEIPTYASGSFRYMAPESQQDLPDYSVKYMINRVYSADGEFIGVTALFYMDVRPNLMALLARGDQQMYERMARLIEPAPRQAAILFCDLHQSGRLSRMMPSVAYFKLVRQLWTGIDAAVADETGIIGKHAGDGAVAYFLVEDLGSPSTAAAAAVRAARKVHEIGDRVFAETLDSECLMKVGLHWGGALYMGQLVPGGRLDVTALGDEVNEASRVQETAGPGETLVSKQLLEQLMPQDAAGLGLDLEKVSYTPLSDVPTVTEKAIKDAGTIPVTGV